jgi:hypothetical protein
MEFLSKLLNLLGIETGSCTIILRPQYLGAKKAFVTQSSPTLTILFIRHILFSKIRPMNYNREV